MNNFKKIWTLDSNGNEILRDLYKENENFSRSTYSYDKYDPYNLIWHETFNNYVHDDIGCDYERYGTHITSNDVVLDVGANIGLFAYRAELRGARKIYSFEPIDKTFRCLVKNTSEKTIPHKLGVGSKNGTKNFVVPENYLHTIGSTSEPDNDILNRRGVATTETVQIIGINDIFQIYDDITYFKLDVEGDEMDILPAISDENLQKLRCVVGEFHTTSRHNIDEVDPKFYIRMENLGFKHFTLHYGNGDLRTFHFWKENYEFNK